MTNYAYLRVSTDSQDIENQKLGILDYCNKKNISKIKFLEDAESGKLEWRKRSLGKIIETAKAGDTIIAAEISRLARSTLQVLEILEVCAEKQISMHISKGQIVMDGSMQSTITATILGLAAQIEREFISQRTKEALQKAKQSGKKLGRPRGKAPTVKLDAYALQIKDYLRKGVSKLSIARIVECAPSTLYAWIKRNKIKA